jgi:hypothetical protein
MPAQTQPRQPPHADAGTFFGLKRRSQPDGHVAKAVVAAMKHPVRVRLEMPLAEAEALDTVLASALDSHHTQRLLDQLWLRSVMIEQWRRTARAERPAFEVRANSILAALDDAL